MTQPVLLIGGTRGTGPLIARRLIDRGVPVRILARDAVRARTLFDRSTEKPFQLEGREGRGVLSRACIRQQHLCSCERPEGGAV